MEKVFDVIILGGGVAGMTAGIYAKRAGKDVLIIERQALGGQVLELRRIENFPSQSEIDGFSLCQLFAEQIKHLDVPVVSDEVQSVDLLPENKQISCKKQTYFAKKVIIATGLQSVKLGIDEESFLGRGVSYCAVCDANFFKGKVVCVASKNASGLKDAKYLSKICKQVIVFDTQKLSVNDLGLDNVTIVSDAKIKKIGGKDFVENVEVSVGGKLQKFDVSAVFVSMGKTPASTLFASQLKLDARGFIVTDERMKTSVENVYAIGDVRNGTLKQIVTACSDGAIAVSG